RLQQVHFVNRNVNSLQNPTLFVKNIINFFQFSLNNTQTQNHLLSIIIFNRLLNGNCVLIYFFSPLIIQNELFNERLSFDQAVLILKIRKVLSICQIKSL